MFIKTYVNFICDSATSFACRYVVELIHNLLRSFSLPDDDFLLFDCQSEAEILTD